MKQAEPATQYLIRRQTETTSTTLSFQYLFTAKVRGCWCLVLIPPLHQGSTSSSPPPSISSISKVSPSLPSWLSTSPQSPSPLHPSPSKSPPQFPNFKSISVPTAQVDQTIALEKHNKDERDENDGNKEDADDIDDASAVSFEQRTNGEEDKSLFDIFPANPFLRVPLAVQIKK